MDVIETRLMEVSPGIVEVDKKFNLIINIIYYGIIITVLSLITIFIFNNIMDFNLLKILSIIFLVIIAITFERIKTNKKKLMIKKAKNIKNREDRL